MSQFSFAGALPCLGYGDTFENKYVFFYRKLFLARSKFVTPLCFLYGFLKIVKHLVDKGMIRPNN